MVLSHELFTLIWEYRIDGSSVGRIDESSDFSLEFFSACLALVSFCFD
jgi:hypothetical protein